ncbi:uncharacterized protein LOC100679021 isoform X1 [Nasonia vitripennis]|uniref:Uncharacterized protein n=1 Tax=Nasonia vitripennis TaxID=7425 RepID=A0A7M7GCW3_NASVI|nr:uncharacterized protein LOC100679021 isoform X1 [Nasonia vitripennis]XP_032451949.1 uncharacterized protein LOC100679021 isoform X1 [Nasonia vitripennis]
MDLLKLLLPLGCVLVLVFRSDAGASGELKRRKRYLIFPQGSNVQLVYCLTIGAYARDGDLVLGLTAALAWELPSKAEAKLTGLLHRRSRAVLYPKIEALLHSTGLDGRSCVMRALCEAGRRSASEIGSGTFLQELLHAVFTLPEDGSTFDNEDCRQYDNAHSGSGSECAELYPSCEHSIYSLDF